MSLFAHLLSRVGGTIQSQIDRERAEQDRKLKNDMAERDYKLRERGVITQEEAEKRAKDRDTLDARRAGYSKRVEGALGKAGTEAAAAMGGPMAAYASAAGTILEERARREAEANGGWVRVDKSDDERLRETENRLRREADSEQDNRRNAFDIEADKRRAKLRRDEILLEARLRGGGGGSGVGSAGGQPPVDTAELMKWRNEWGKLTGEEREIAGGFSRLRAATAKGANAMTASDDIGLIYGFMKMQDPGSAVKEGEYANAENAAGVPEKTRQLYNKVLSGQKLTPAMRTEFVRTANQSAREANERTRRKATDLMPLLTTRRINPSEVITSPFSGLLDEGNPYRRK